MQDTSKPFEPPFRCELHPDYTAEQPPTTHCHVCWVLWHRRHKPTKAVAPVQSREGWRYKGALFASGQPMLFVAEGKEFRTVDGAYLAVSTFLEDRLRCKQPKKCSCGGRRTTT